jgi:N-acetylneuraminate lyase
MSTRTTSRLHRLAGHVAAPVAAPSVALHPLFEGRPNLMLVPIATPLLSSGAPSVDVPSLRRYVKHLYAAGCEGLYVGGSSGEGYHMEESMRMELCTACVDASKSASQGSSGKIVMVHVGAAKSAEALRLAAHAVSAGADCIASIPPYVGSPLPTFAEVKAFYAELARVSSPKPVICYNIPGLTGQNLSVSELSELMAIPGVEGIKYSDPDVASLLSLTEACPGKVIFNGIDSMLSFGLQCGAHGGIGTTYNILPELYLSIDRLTRAGDTAEAIAAVRKANRANSQYKVVAGKQMQCVKQILVWQGVLRGDSEGGGCSRMVQAEALSEEEVGVLRVAVESIPELKATLSC